MTGGGPARLAGAPGVHPALWEAARRVAAVMATPAGGAVLRVDADGLVLGDARVAFAERYPVDDEGDRRPAQVAGWDLPSALAAWARGNPVVADGPGPAADAVRACGGGIAATEHEVAEGAADLLRRLAPLATVLGHRGRRARCCPPEAIAALLTG